MLYILDNDSPPGTRARLSRVPTWGIGAGVAIVALGFFAWRENWLRLPLGGWQIARYLAQDAGPRRQRRALEQIAGRLSQGDPAVRNWYPRVVGLSRSADPEVRQAAARVMGLDPRNDAFRNALGALLEDVSPLVRRASAVALAASGDPRARPELRAMLHSYTVYSPYSGRLRLRAKEGDRTKPGSPLASVEAREIRSPLPGFISHLYEPDGAGIRTGQRIADIAPGEPQLLDALRAIAAAGDRYDLDQVQRFTQQGLAERLRQQAVETVAQIRSRAK